MRHPLRPKVVHRVKIIEPRHDAVPQMEHVGCEKLSEWRALVYCEAKEVADDFEVADSIFDFRCT